MYVAHFCGAAGFTYSSIMHVSRYFYYSNWLNVTVSYSKRALSSYIMHCNNKALLFGATWRMSDIFVCE